jgi:hypothetical protein
MLLIALLHNVQGAIKNYTTRRQLGNLNPNQLLDVAIAPQAALKESKKANLWVFMKDFIRRKTNSRGQ